jgi:ornithine carbamoyltransferase
MKDTARVLGRLYDGIEYRGYGQKIVSELAEFAGVPVWNGLTDEFHPTQVLAYLMTIIEHITRPLKEVTLAYVGDGRNNMAISLMVGCCKMGMDYRLVAPKGTAPRGLAGGEVPVRGRRNRSPHHAYRRHQRRHEGRGCGLIRTYG